MALLTLAALVMGILALQRVDSPKLGDLGLVAVAGHTYFVARRVTGPHVSHIPEPDHPLDGVS
jgi:hypothetical protein